MKDLITVVVPVYNVENYLEKCVNSIINQTYKNLEIILVDDGATDSSSKICDNLAEIDDRIKVIHKENGGLSSARNAGIDVAQGKYIGFIDSDDYIDDRMFEILYNSIIDNNADLSVCNYSWVNEEGRAFNTTKLLDDSYSAVDVLSKYLLEDFASWVIACNKLYKTDLFSNIRYPIGKVNEDSFTIHRVLDKCDRISSVSDSLYFYFQRQGSITKTTFKLSKLDVVDSHFERASYYLNSDKFDKKDIPISKTLIMALRSYHSVCFGVESNDLDSEFKTKNKEIQKKYRFLFKNLHLKIDKSIGIKSVIIMFMCYISIYYTYKFLDLLNKIGE